MEDTIIQRNQFIKILAIGAIGGVLGGVVFVGIFFYFNQSSLQKKGASNTVATAVVPQQIHISPQPDTVNDCDILPKNSQIPCKNNINRNLAQKTGSVSYCSKLIGATANAKQALRSSCEMSILSAKSLKQKNTDVCNEATSLEVREICKTSYYLHIAQQENNIKECSSAPDTVIRNVCYNNFLFSSAKTTSSFNCSTLKGTLAQKDCTIIKSVFGSKPDVKAVVSACKKVTSRTFKTFCASIPGLPISMSI